MAPSIKRQMRSTQGKEEPTVEALFIDLFIILFIASVGFDLLECGLTMNTSLIREDTL